MKNFSNTHSINISSLLKKAEVALLTRNFQSFREIFIDIWSDVNETPNFSVFPEEAELLQIAGEFLIHYGKAYNLNNYQTRGKDLLTQAISFYTTQKQYDRAFNSQIVLAFAYFQEGAKEEYIAFLLDAESRFSGDKCNFNYLKLQLNLLIYELESARIEDASKRISDNLIFFRQTSNAKVKTQFFIEAGITYRRLKSFENAYFFLTEALKLARKIKNIHYEASVYNNLANTYRSDKKFKQALEYSNKALELANDQDGWKAVFLDTKALIHYDQKDYENADIIIDEAIALFRQGDDFGGLCEALWNKTRILRKLDLQELAFQSFIECYQLAAERIGQETAYAYLNKILEFMPLIPDGNLFEKIDAVKRQLIEKALLKSGGKITEAAKILGIDHRTLSAMMKNFPSLYSDLGIKRKNRSINSKNFC